MVLALGFIWLSFGVLDSRQQWDVKIKAKSAEVAKVEKEIDVLINGAEDFGVEFVKNVVAPIKEPPPGLWSSAANAKYEEQIAAGVEPRLAFEAAMNLFVDKKVVDAYQKALKELNDVQKSPVPDEIQLDAAVKAFDAAERDMAASMTKLDDAYAFFRGQKGPGGIISLAGKTMSIDAMRQTVVHFRSIIYAQESQFKIMYSDGEKNKTRMENSVAETKFEAEILQQAAANGQRELEDRTKEVEELKVTKAKELMELANEESKRDKAIADLADLNSRYDAVLARTRQLAALVKKKEIEFDQQRGIKGAVITENGLVPEGRVQKVNDENGTIEINIGYELGVKSGRQLYVFRWVPEAKYLGIVEIVEAKGGSSVGKMLPEFRQITIRPNDIVSTEITRPTSSESN
jgi:hypothetical protein